MRARFIALVLFSLVTAPVVAAWPDACAHDAPALASHGEHADHGMHETMAMAGEMAAEAPCHCDADCAEHCDAAVSAALVDVDRPDAPLPSVTQTSASERRFHEDPPRGAPLRPPQARSS